jgi:hypothetical protein
VTKLAGGASPRDADAGCQDDVTNVACGTAHGDGNASCQDTAAKVACDTTHGHGRWGRQLLGQHHEIGSRSHGIGSKPKLLSDTRCYGY